MALKELHERYGKNHRSEFRRVQEKLFWKDSKLYSAATQALNKALVSWITKTECSPILSQKCRFDHDS